MSNDHQTYKRAATAALCGLIAQFFLAVIVAIVGIAYDSKAVFAATVYIVGGLPVWLILWAVFNQHKQERIEALEAEQLAEADAEAAALFNEAGQQLQQARKRLEHLNKYWINGVSVLLAGWLLGLGGYLFSSAFGLYKEHLNAVADGGSAVTWSASKLYAAAISGNANPLVLLFVLGGLAFLGFLASRYVAGMTKVKEWQPLRGGATYMIGNVVVILLLLFGGTVPVLINNQNKMGFAILAIAIPAIMILLGAEILLSFIFGIYRPRKAGDVIRPAFDSRILGWLARPESLGKIIGETLNYQFGFEISRSWFVDLLNKSIVGLCAFGTVVLLGMSCITIVEPQQKAAILSNGKIQRIVGPGFYFKYPWPVGTSEKYNVDRIQRFTVGSAQGDSTQAVNNYEVDEAREAYNRIVGEKFGIWRNDHKPGVYWDNAHTRGAENYLVIAPVSERGEKDGERVANSVAGELAGIDMVVDYRVNDLEKYITSTDRPRQMLEAVALESLSKYLAYKDIDMLIGEGRAFGARELQTLLQKDVDRANLGVEIVFTGFSAIHPPQGGDVAKAFHEQNGALQEMQTEIENAEKDAISMYAKVAGSREMAIQIKDALEALDNMKLKGGDEKEIAALSAKVELLLDQAGGTASQKLQEARAYRWRVALDEQSSARNFSAQQKAYEAAPDYFKIRMMLQTLAEGLKGRKKVIVDSKDLDQSILRMDLKDSGSMMGSLFNND